MIRKDEAKYTKYVVQRVPAIVQWVKDPVLLQLWYRLATAALIWPLAQELLPAAREAVKRKKEKKDYSNLVFKVHKTYIELQMLFM